MKPIQIKNHIIPIYLGLAILLLTQLTVLTALFIILPLILTSIAIYLHQRKVGIVGMAVFYLLSIPQYAVLTIDDPLQAYLLVFLVILPSLFLLYQILSMQTLTHLLDEMRIQKKAIIYTVISGAVTFFLFYLLCLSIGNATILNPENIHGQILLLAGISFIIFTPLLMYQKEVEA